MDRPIKDPTSAEGLLHHAEWLRHLAARLVATDDDADELVQQTWVAALQQQRPASEATLRGWLSSIARNLARLTYRRNQRRVQREAKVARRESLPSASEVAERLQIERLVVDALQSLEEPYRSALVYRFHEGLTPAEIARRLSSPQGTIRARIHRGLQLLRGRLEASLGRDHWQHSLGFLIGSLGSAPTPTAVGSGAGILGALIMNKTALVAVTAAAAILGTGWWLLDPGHEASRPIAKMQRSVDGATAELTSARSASDQTIAPPVVDSVAREPIAGTRVVAEDVALAGSEPPSAQPGTGSVVIELRDRNGAPMTNSYGRVWMRVAPREANRDTIDWLQVPEREESFARTIAFANVPLDRLLQIRLEMFWNPSLRDRSEVFDGPRRPGETVTCPIVVRETMAHLTGRIVSVDGMLQQGLDVNVRTYLTGMPKNSGYFDHHLRTDADARFTLELTPSSQAGRRAIFRVPSGATADVDLAGPFTPEASDLGDIVVEFEPVLVAGRVLDGDGNGVEFARIDVAGLEAGSRASDPGAWTWYGVLYAESQAGGAFTIRTKRQVAPRLRISASHDRGTQSKVDVAPGTSDLVLQLSMGHALRGRILTNGAEGITQFRVKALDESGGLQFEQVDAQGHFAFRRLNSATVDIVVELLAKEVHVEKGVAVAAADDREIEIDLRSKVRTLSLRAVDLEDRPVARTSMRLLVLDGAWQGETRACETDEQGFAALPLPSSVDRLRVWTTESRATEIEWRSERQDVRLAKGIAVRITLDPNLPLLDDPFSLTLQTKPVGDQGRSDLTAPCFPVDEHHEASGCVQMFGTYSIIPWLNERIPTGSRGRRLPVLDGATIQVLDRSGVQSFRVSLHPDAVAAIHAQFAKQSQPRR